MLLTCSICETQYQPHHHNSKVTPYCSRECALAGISKKQKTIPTTCIQCGTLVIAKGRQMLEQYRRGRVYCSEVCRDQFLQEFRSKTMKQTNISHQVQFSNRMKENNPMTDANVREKCSQTLKQIGWKPPIRGGNGKPAPKAQQYLSNRLGWPMEVIVPIGRRPNYPTHYKIDIADQKNKIAIEVDGGSHYSLSRREQDRKKDAFLESHGWKVFRFSNQQVMERFEECVQTVLSTILK